MNTPPERQQQFTCELGHKLWKYFIGEKRGAHMLLCPVCDKDEIMKLLTKEDADGTR